MHGLFKWLLYIDESSLNKVKEALSIFFWLQWQCISVIKRIKEGGKHHAHFHFHLAAAESWHWWLPAPSQVDISCVVGDGGGLQCQPSSRYQAF